MDIRFLIDVLIIGLSVYLIFEVVFQNRFKLSCIQRVLAGCIVVGIMCLLEKGIDHFL